MELHTSIMYIRKGVGVMVDFGAGRGLSWDEHPFSGTVIVSRPQQMGTLWHHFQWVC